MAFSLTPSVQIERDRSGRIRSLSHGGQPDGLELRILNAQKLAEAYLRDVAGIYGIDPNWLNALDQNPSQVISNAGTELRFARQGAITGTATVSFQQTHFGLPVWQAGLTVNMLAEPLRATASISTLHPASDVARPKKDTKCIGGHITSQSLAKLLNVIRPQHKKGQICSEMELGETSQLSARKSVICSSPLSFS